MPTQTAPSFSNLKPHEAELLAHLQEEAAEIVMAISKAERHGLASSHPAPGSKDNRFEIARELGQLMAIAGTMIGLGMLDEWVIEFGRTEKLTKFNTYSHHVKVDPVTEAIEIVK